MLFIIAKVNSDRFCEIFFLLIISTIEVYSQFFVLNLLRTIELTDFDHRTGIQIVVKRRFVVIFSNPKNRI